MIVMIIINMTCTVHCNDSKKKNKKQKNNSMIDSFSSIVCHCSSHWPHGGAVRLKTPQFKHFLAVEEGWSHSEAERPSCSGRGTHPGPNIVPSCVPELRCPITEECCSSFLGLFLSVRCLWRVQPSSPHFIMVQHAPFSTSKHRTIIRWRVTAKRFANKNWAGFIVLSK